jgi:hypothetical protein
MSVIAIVIALAMVTFYYIIKAVGLRRHRR